jgi:4-carboxymuconolactone decarboxylase
VAPAGGSGDELERGIGLFGKVLGEDRAEDLRREIAAGEFGSEMAAWAAEFVVGKVWSRQGLDPRLRICAALGMLIALKQTDELKYQVAVALEHGLSAAEIEEVLYAAVPIVGFPAASTARTAIAEALAAG